MEYSPGVKGLRVVFSGSDLRFDGMTMYSRFKIFRVKVPFVFWETDLHEMCGISAEAKGYFHGWHFHLMPSQNRIRVRTL